MNTQSIDNARDADLRLSLPAMRRAAQRAREVAAQTGTAIIVSRNGVIEHLLPNLAEAADRVQEPPVPYGEKE